VKKRITHAGELAYIALILIGHALLHDIFPCSRYVLSIHAARASVILSSDVYPDGIGGKGAAAPKTRTQNFLNVLNTSDNLFLLTI